MIYIDTARCTGCGACLRICPHGAIELCDGRAHVLQDECLGCEQCLAVCPESAILALTEEQEESALPTRVEAALTPARTIQRLPAIAVGGALIALGRTVLPRLLDLASERRPRSLSRKNADQGSGRGSTSGRRHRWRGGARGA